MADVCVQLALQTFIAFVVHSLATEMGLFGLLRGSSLLVVRAVARATTTAGVVTRVIFFIRHQSVPPTSSLAYSTSYAWEAPVRLKVEKRAVHHLCMQFLYLIEHEPYLARLRACINWVESLLDLEYHILEARDRHITVNVKFVSVNEGLREKTQVCWLYLL